MLRTVAGLAVVVLLSPVTLVPLHGGSGEVPSDALKLTLYRADDSLSFPSARSAPEGIVEVAKLLMYFAAVAASDVNDLTHRRPPVAVLRLAWRSRIQLVAAVLVVCLWPATAPQ